MAVVKPWSIPRLEWQTVQSLTYRDGLPVNLIGPATVISQSFDRGHQINEIRHEENFARVHSF